MPLTTTSAESNHYKLSIDYKGISYTYSAIMYHHSAGIQSWYVKTKDRLLTFTYDDYKKKLTQVLDPGESRLPDNFIELLEREFKK